MKVLEMIKKLQELPKDAEVVDLNEGDSLWEIEGFQSIREGIYYLTIGARWEVRRKEK